MSEIEKSKFLFVYGTLKKGGSGHGTISDLRMRTTLRVGNLAMFSLGGFPAVFRQEGNSVYGEVFELPSLQGDAILSIVDRYEGINVTSQQWYKRELVETELYGKVWCYVQPPPVGRFAFVADGVWRGPGTSSILMCNGLPPPVQNNYEHGQYNYSHASPNAQGAAYGNIGQKVQEASTYKAPKKRSSLENIYPIAVASNKPIETPPPVSKGDASVI